METWSPEGKGHVKTKAISEQKYGFSNRGTFRQFAFNVSKNFNFRFNNKRNCFWLRLRTTHEQHTRGSKVKNIDS